MNESDKKLITEWLGEEWSDFVRWENTIYSDESKAVVKEQHFGTVPFANRTFTASQDFFACFEKLVEMGEIRSIFAYACVVHVKERGHIVHGLENAIVDLYQWLNSRTESGHYRLCCLIAEWLKEKEQ
jgi:hypothetical protein